MSLPESSTSVNAEELESQIDALVFDLGLVCEGVEGTALVFVPLPNARVADDAIESIIKRLTSHDEIRQGLEGIDSIKIVAP
jgi:hypothetical protein